MTEINWLLEAEAIRQDIIALRQSFHMYPELAMEEERTVGIVEKALTGFGIKTQRIAGTGLVGLLEGAAPGKTVALRADMDALPLTDHKKVPYASKIPGKMHACGHDAHTASLLGAARLLAKYREQIEGTVKFLFQPAEETTGGALPMIQAGAMEAPKVDAVFGLHVSPEIEAGKIGIIYGKAYAAVDEFDAVIRGRESHGAAPQNGIDAIVVGAQALSALQTFVSRSLDPNDAAVVTVGKFNAGYQRNIVADKAELAGTIRTLEPATRELARQKVSSILGGVAESLGATAEVTITPGYPSVVNDDTMTDLVKKSASAVLGEENVITLKKPRLGGEDFAYFLQQAPGSFYRLGVGNAAKGIIQPAHTHFFDIDEAALPLAAALHAQIAVDFLRAAAKS